MENVLDKSVLQPKKFSLIDLARTALVGSLGVLSIVYLSNPTGGMVELIPDNLPLLGNVDEAAMAAMLIYSIRFVKDRLAGR